MLNEAYPGYFCHVTDNEKDPYIPSYEIGDEEFYQLLISLNVTQDLLRSEKRAGFEEVLLTSFGQKNGMRSVLYGAAQPYYNNVSLDVNCYGYAMIQPMWVNPGYMSGVYCYGSSVYQIANYVISDYYERGLSARIISGLDL